MQRETGSSSPILIHPAGALKPVFVQLPAPARRFNPRHIVAEAIVACLMEGRAPTPDEVEKVAARIWSDVQAGDVRIGWSDLAPGCARRRRMMATARTALGRPTAPSARDGGEAPDPWPGACGPPFLAAREGAHRREEERAAGASPFGNGRSGGAHMTGFATILVLACASALLALTAWLVRRKRRRPPPPKARAAPLADVRGRPDIQGEIIGWIVPDRPSDRDATG